MTIEKTFQGAYKIFDAEIGTRQYMGYTKKQAIAKFIQDKKDYLEKHSTFINQN